MDKRERKSDIMFNIFKILHRHSDEEHKLTQQEIIDKLEQYYEMKPDRKVIRDNILDLEQHISDFGYDEYNSYGIEYRKIKRKNKNKKTGEEIDNSMYSDFYLDHLFTYNRYQVNEDLQDEFLPQLDRDGKLSTIRQK